MLQSSYDRSFIHAVIYTDPPDFPAGAIIAGVSSENMVQYGKEEPTEDESE
jgi:hypothetical protein